MPGGRLTFKGEKKKSKHKRRRDEADKYSEEQEGWIDVPDAAEAHGPLYITQRTGLPSAVSSTSSTPRICLAIQPTLANKVIPHTLQSSAALLNSMDGVDLEDRDTFTVAEDDSNLEPSDVNHVWVATRIIDSETKITLRSSNGRFLSCDEIGRVSCDREARGLQEEWELLEHPSKKFALKGPYDKYLCLDEVAGGKLEFRCDSDTISDDELWDIRMQARFLKEIRERRQESSRNRAKHVDEGYTIIRDVKAAEDEQIRKFQTRGGGRLVGSRDDAKDLRKAQKAGNLGEVMLDRRKKLKHDRYC